MTSLTLVGMKGIAVVCMTSLTNMLSVSCCFPVLTILVLQTLQIQVAQRMAASATRVQVEFENITIVLKTFSRG